MRKDTKILVREARKSKQIRAEQQRRKQLDKQLARANKTRRS